MSVAKTPTVLQLESSECGAASLAMVLEYYGCVVPLEKLRYECGISRDGSRASHILAVARQYGLDSNAIKLTAEELLEQEGPLVLFWEYNHFLVFEGVEKDKIYLNDPALGKREMSLESFEKSFSNIALTFHPNQHFKKTAPRPGFAYFIWARLQSSKTALVFLALASALSITSGVFSASVLQILIDQIFVNSNHQWTEWLIAFLVSVVVLRVYADVAIYRVSVRLRTKLSVVSLDKTLRRIFHLPMSFFSQRSPNDITNRMMLNLEISQALSQQLLLLWVSFVVSLVYFVVIWFYSTILSVIAVSGFLITLYLFRLILQKSTDLMGRMSREKGNLVTASMASIEAIETIKANGAEEEFFSKWAGYQAKSLNVQRQLSNKVIKMNLLPLLLFTVQILLLISVGAWQCIQNQLSIGQLIAVIFLLVWAFEPLNRLVQLSREVQGMSANLLRINDLDRYPIPKRKRRDSDAQKEAMSMVKLSGALEIKSLTFGYNQYEAPFIKDFSLTIKPGSRVAIVGPSGCGKSTIAKLIAGVLTPWDGEILFDAKAKEDILAQIFESSFVLIDDNQLIFEGSVRENLTLWDDTIVEQDLVTSCKDAQIHDVITQRPRGYDSIVKEGGINFSGGQIQRLEYARAFIRNPSILVLDESSSAIDPKTNGLIDRAIRQRGCSVIIMSHQYETIHDCDEIIVMENGRIVERGDHQTLIREGILYRELVEV